MDDPRARAARAYLEAKVSAASPMELIAVLYEALAREVRTAADGIDAADPARKGAAIGRALDILGVLRTSLDHRRGGEIATNLERVYVYWTGRLTVANARMERAPLDEIGRQVGALRGAWSATAEPVGAP
jgi:flagellar protein FliS